ncbi:MAG: hypothetical protein ABI209_04670 [Edaphobacter sp.]
MDSVRFGRALGFGARAAAKTLMTAVDAATSPNPSATKGKPTTPASTSAPPSASAAAPSSASSASSASDRSTVVRAEGPGAWIGEQTARTTAQAQQTGRGLKEGGRRFRQAVGGRLVTLSGVLWLELTGVFFGVFAVFAAGGAWKMRAARHATVTNHDAHMQFLIAATMALIFGYFCVSSFAKANRRGKQAR